MKPKLGAFFQGAVLKTVLIWFGCGIGSAHAEGLSGKWKASGLKSTWNLGDWGSACGPAPSGNSGAGPGSGAATVQIIEQGSELSIRGFGRTYTTVQCWEQFPGLSRVSHTAGAKTWRNVCKTGSRDSRQATIITTLAARDDDTLYFDETGQYQLVIKGQNCTASVRRTRAFKRIRAGEAPTPAAEPSNVPTKRAAEDSNRASAKPCASPGRPARLEVRPASKLMRPGETFRFKSVVTDEKGCVLATVPRFELLDDDARLSVQRRGLIKVSDAAKEGSFGVAATVAGKSVKVRVEIASEERYQALLRARGLNEAGESQEAAVTLIQGGSLGARAAVTQNRAAARRRTLMIALGISALVLGLVGLVLVQRRRKRPGSAPSDLIEVGVGTTAFNQEQREGRVCPTCRTEYTERDEFCPKDGNRLVMLSSAAAPPAPGGGICPACQKGFDPGISECPEHGEALVPAAVYPSDGGEESAKICPVCGTQYPGQSQFCGKDGAFLVPVN